MALDRRSAMQSLKALHKKERVWEASPTPMLLRLGIGLVADSEIAVRDRSHRVFVQSQSLKELLLRM